MYRNVHPREGWQRKARSAAKRNEDLQRTARPRLRCCSRGTRHTKSGRGYALKNIFQEVNLCVEFSLIFETEINICSLAESYYRCFHSGYLSLMWLHYLPRSRSNLHITTKIYCRWTAIRWLGRWSIKIRGSIHHLTREINLTTCSCSWVLITLQPIVSS